MAKSGKGQGPRRPWMEWEKDKLRQMIRDGIMPLGCISEFPHRKPSAVTSMYKEVKYQVVREEKGNDYENPGKLVLPMLDADDPGQSDDYWLNWKDQAKRSNRNFLAALERAGFAA